MCIRDSLKDVRLKLEVRDYHGFRFRLDSENSKYECSIKHVYGAVSYTHLDVYKRQVKDMDSHITCCYRIKPEIDNL